MNPKVQGEVLFELRRVGAFVRVSAVHVERNIEVCLAAPATAGVDALKAAALHKLAYVLAKKAPA